MVFKRVPGAAVAVESPEALFQDLRNRKIKGLLSHQADILRAYHREMKESPDVAIEGPTGSGKTLVGLLIGEWRRRHYSQMVVYLCPTKQLVNQVVKQGKSYGIKAVALTGPKADFPPADASEYSSGEVIAVTTYSALFNTKSFFEGAGALICDDAHAAEDYVASYWSLLITKKYDRGTFDAMVGVLRDLISPGDFARLRADGSAYSGRVDHRFRSKPISDSGMPITSERSDAGYGLLG